MRVVKKKTPIRLYCKLCDVTIDALFKEQHKKASGHMALAKAFRSAGRFSRRYRNESS